MDTAAPTLENLFRQLGLPSTPDAIEDFISRHRLQANRALTDADFWSASQAEFIRECWDDDADWAEVVDQLDARLHE